MSTVLPTDKQDRKDTPVCSGVLDYFPAALAEVARVSKAGNDQHNPGQPLHWARGKANDHADCIIRHLMERGTMDTDGMRHSAKVAWRALALLQEELEAAGAPMARGGKEPGDPNKQKSASDMLYDIWMKRPPRPAYPSLGDALLKGFSGAGVSPVTPLLDQASKEWLGRKSLEIIAREQRAQREIECAQLKGGPDLPQGYNAP